MVGGVTSAVVMASVPDQNGVIHTCYRNTVLQKTFRVIDSPSETCNTNETHLSWNQSGQSGGPQVAYIGVKEDGMLDTDYSKTSAITLLCLKLEVLRAISMYALRRTLHRSFHGILVALVVQGSQLSTPR
jgi:hypothetical protein